MKKEKKIKVWAIVCNAGGDDYIGDADCSLGFPLPECDCGYTEALAIFENKWAAKRWLKRGGKYKCKIKVVPCEIILKCQKTKRK